MRRSVCLVLCGVFFAHVPIAVSAQEFGVVTSPVLTLDQEALFVESGFADLISAEIERRRALLTEENRRIEVELGAEELALTEKRAEMDPTEFRALADAFDQKVQLLRQEQDAKLVQLQRMRDDERQNFLRRMTPILAEIVRERDALVVIDLRAAIISADAIDVTDVAIERMKEALAPLNAPDTPLVTPLPKDDPGTIAPAPTLDITPNDP